MAPYTEEDSGEKRRQTTKTKQKSLNMTHMKDILPPLLKYNVIVTEFTNHRRKEQIYHPQDGAKIKISRRK